MTELFISPIKPSEYNKSDGYLIDPEVYAKEMKVNWPYTEIYFQVGTPFALEWLLKKNAHSIGSPGALHSDRVTVSFGANPREDAIEFALWHRALIPQNYTLYLFDEGLTTLVEIGPDVSTEDLWKILS
jgi:hypothetical protein